MSDTMREIARPFPEKYVHTNPSGGGSYVKHHVVNQRLIQILSVPPSFEKVEIIFGDVAEIKPNPNGKSQRAKEGRPALKNVIVGVIARLTVEIDGYKIVVEEAGDCEEPHNWSSDGQRLKDAMSDAYKRCAMRLGCGLHLWSQDEYFLFEKLSSGTEQRTGSTSNSEAGAKAPSQDVAKSPTSGGEPVEPPAPPTSPVPTEGVEAPATDAGGEVSSDTKAEASSDGNVYELIANAMSDRTMYPKVLTAANKSALAKKAIPEKGISRDNILDLPEEVLNEVADVLNLRQGALA